MSTSSASVGAVRENLVVDVGPGVQAHRRAPQQPTARSVSRSAAPGPASYEMHGHLSTFHNGPLHHRAQCLPPGECSYGRGLFDRHPGQLTAVASSTTPRARPRSPGSRECSHETTTVAQRVPARVEHSGSTTTAADEDRVRRRRVPTTPPVPHRQYTHRGRYPEPGGVALDPLRAGRVPLERDRPATRIGPRPFDCHRSGTGADVPQQLSGFRRERADRCDPEGRVC